MEKEYILSVDQSTQGTKALLLNKRGEIICRADRSHKQIVSNQGWVSHNLDEIYRNTITVVKDLIEKSGIRKNEIAGMGISNQRETSAAWNKVTGEPADDAIVWQCSRAKDICLEIENTEIDRSIQKRTGIKISPFFPASKFAWLLRNAPKAKEWNEKGELAFGTIDSWLVYKLTKGQSYKTDYSNASRTQLFNLETLQWDREICDAFQLNLDSLPEVCDSDALFGETDFEGYLDEPIPIHGVMGDSHGALFGQGCRKPGMVKATYGTGSSVMMNVGEKPVYSNHGIVTSLAWGMNGKVNYVLEGNINYTGAAITWLKDEVGLINSAAETADLAKTAKAEDTTYLVPAFTGLGAPYWDNDAKAILCGMSRMTGKAEIVKAAVESIGYQITDILKCMSADSELDIHELRVDGGPTKNDYLMQFQSDIADTKVLVPSAEELSGIGAGYMAGLALGVYDDSVFGVMSRTSYEPVMNRDDSESRYQGWKDAVMRCTCHS